MFVIPFINLLGGQCVGLSQTDGQGEPFLDSDPVALAKKWEQAGASWLHIVDLDGAKNQKLQQLDVIESIARETHIRLQVGGGVRDEDDIRRLISAGADRVVIGSMAIFNPPLVGSWITHLGREKVMLSMDVRLHASGIPEVLVHGWGQGSSFSLWDVLSAYKGSGLKTVLCTDVQRGGRLSGINRALYVNIRQIWSELDVIAAGGTNSLEDIQALKEIGVHAVVVGRALDEGKIAFAQALETAQ